MGGIGKAGLLAVALLGVTAPAAAATTRYAEPNGNGIQPCAQADPCDIQTAIEGNTAADNDEVIVLPGDYTIGGTAGDTLVVANKLNIHGQAGQPRPRLLTAAPDGLRLGAGGTDSTIAGLTIEHTGTGTALLLPLPATVSRVYAHTTGAAACDPSSVSLLLRDSVCWTSGTGHAVNIHASGGTITPGLTNVTAIASGPGGALHSAIGVDSSGVASISVDALNVIADSATDDDLYVEADIIGSASLTMSHSNYDTASTSGSTAQVTPVASGDNQNFPPVFVNAASGDFHEAATSPTIDAGFADSTTGPTDLDGNPRTAGAAIDIGAFEFTASATPDTTAPDTAITTTPKKSSRKRKARFEFTSDDPAATFQCSLDGKPFAPCTSPFVRKVKRGKHTFDVRATDQAGNTDQTPAHASWKVRKKRKHRH